MNFEFSADQKLTGDQARRLLTDESSLQRARAVLESDSAHDDSLWAKAVELGWTACSIPEQYGGLGSGYLDLCMIAEEIGRALAPVPLSSSVYLFAEALLLYGTEQQRTQWLPKIASGEVIGTLAVAEDFVQPTADNIRCAFSDGRINGVKIAVPDGIKAQVAVVVAKEGSRCRLCLVDLTAEGVQAEEAPSLDGSRSLANLTLSNAPAQLLNADLDGWEQLCHVQERAAVLFAFEQIGGADAALEMARSYSLERYAFGRQIATYQAVKHRLADMYIKNQLARSNSYYGAWALSNNDAQLPLASATARVSATQAYEYAAKECIQLHGGVGFTWEFDCHLFYRRSKLLSLALGGESEWKDRIVRALEQSNQLEVLD